MTVFHVQLRGYDSKIAGWPSPVLRIPKATIRRIFSSGKAIDTTEYDVNANAQVVYWRSKATPPHEPVAEVEVAATLTTLSSPVAVAIVGAVATVVAAWLGRASSPDLNTPPAALVEACRDDLSRLQTVTDLEESSVSGVKNAARGALGTCDRVVDVLEDR